mmetsp:Transcript_28678/g.27477  ORF Transcript_28678/g.27477 Transcript_28678/m.27477 type:complete len:155 (+) Transcript_28678:152-616(+)
MDKQIKVDLQSEKEDISSSHKTDIGFDWASSSLFYDLLYGGMAGGTLGLGHSVYKGFYKGLIKQPGFGMQASLVAGACVLRCGAFYPIYSITKNSFINLRRKRDNYNHFTAGALAGGLVFLPSKNSKTLILASFGAGIAMTIIEIVPFKKILFE